jgi:hypothetical protein
MVNFHNCLDFLCAEIETMETLIRPFKVHESAIPLINYKQPAPSKEVPAEPGAGAECAAMDEVYMSTIRSREGEREKTRTGTA